MTMIPTTTRTTRTARLVARAREDASYLDDGYCEQIDTICGDFFDDPTSWKGRFGQTLLNLLQPREAQALRFVELVGELYYLDEEALDDVEAEHEVVRLALAAKTCLHQYTDEPFNDWFGVLMDQKDNVPMDTFKGSLKDLERECERDGTTCDWHEEIEWKGRTFCVALL